ncbi:MAG: hypothetical protein RL385_2824, partial [Pseudomonadota bacterium]
FHHHTLRQSRRNVSSPAEQRRTKGEASGSGSCVRLWTHDDLGIEFLRTNQRLCVISSRRKISSTESMDQHPQRDANPVNGDLSRRERRAGRGILR